MKHIILTVLFFALTGLGNLYAQGAIKRKWVLSDKVYFGGNIGLMFGTITNIDISPKIGYKFTPKFRAAIGVSYQYYNHNKLSYSTSIYGGSVLSEYVIFGNGILHAEYELLNLETQYFDIANTHAGNNRFWIGSPLVGAGYQFPMGEDSFMFLLVLYNLNPSLNSPYENPIVRIGFNF